MFKEDGTARTLGELIARLEHGIATAQRDEDTAISLSRTEAQAVLPDLLLAQTERMRAE